MQNIFLPWAVRDFLFRPSLIPVAYNNMASRTTSMLSKVFETILSTLLFTLKVVHINRRCSIYLLKFPFLYFY